MYKINVEGHFNSAHSLRGYEGKCEDLHGHNWRVEVAMCADDLDKSGMVVDFKKLREALNDVLVGLDHKYLNNLGYFKEVNPTSENIARYVFYQIEDEFPELVLDSVTVWETERAAATYRE